MKRNFWVSMKWDWMTEFLRYCVQKFLYCTKDVGIIKGLEAAMESKTGISAAHVASLSLTLRPSHACHGKQCAKLVRC